MKLKFRPSVEHLDARDLPSGNPLDPFVPNPPPGSSVQLTNADDMPSEPSLASAPPADPSQQADAPSELQPVVALPATIVSDPAAITDQSQTTGSPTVSGSELAIGTPSDTTLHPISVLPCDVSNDLTNEDDVKITIKTTPVSSKDLIDTLVNDAKNNKAIQKLLDDSFKDKMGTDITTAAEQAKWAKEPVIFGVARDKGAVVGGGAANAVKFSVENFDKALQKDKAMIIQVFKNVITYYDANGKQIGAPAEDFTIEGFAVDAKGVMVGLDLHAFYPSLGGGIAKITYVTEWEVGWGTYEGKDATQSGVFYQGKTLPAKNPITWLGETTIYLTSYSLNSKGEWAFEDRSTGADVAGTDGKIKK